MKILIVEDNDLIAKTLHRNLKDEYHIDIAVNGLSGIYMATAVNYDMILLDLNLPDIDGEEVCERLRSSNVTTPIIVTSGRGEVKNKVNLLSIGADDYLVKPFNLEELKIRIQTALRHTVNKAPTGKIVIDDLTLDPYSHEVTHQNQKIELRRKEFEMLEYLMYNQGQTLTRIMIMEHIWDTNENLWANVIDVHIKHLRDKIDRAFNTNLIQTVHGLGYKIESSRKDKIR